VGKRRKSRECALQLLFELEFNSADRENLIRQYWDQHGATPEIREYGTWLVERVFEHREEIDGLIQAASEHWRLARMPVVDRNVLRVAVCELLHEPSLVPAIVIDEAIEIAKKYSGNEAAVFVNGVLDAVRKNTGREGPPAKTKAREGKHEPEDRRHGKKDRSAGPR
jgi:N utilization substance protein B